MLKKRVVAALLLIPLVTVIVWSGSIPTSILAALWGGVATFEFYRMVSRIKIKPLSIFGVAWSVLFTLSPYFGETGLLLLLTGVVVIPLIWLLLQPGKEDAFSRWVWTLAGAIYIGWLMSYLVAVRSGFAPLAISEREGRNWLFYILFVSFGSDTLAYFTGRVFGRHYLAPYVSPHKTWEGAAGGFIGAIAISLLFTLPLPQALPLSFSRAVILALAVSISGQLGDLVKSLLKRNMGVKDSSNLIPGHGGFLDRIDSILFAGAVVYYYVLLMSW